MSTAWTVPAEVRLGSESAGFASSEPSVGRTLLQRGMTAVGWHALADEARSFDPTSLGGRSSTPQRVNCPRGTMGQEHSGHGAMFIARAAAHQSRWVLDSPGSST